MEKPAHLDAIGAKPDDNAGLSALVHALRVDVAQLAELISDHFTHASHSPTVAPPPPPPSGAELAALASAEAAVISNQRDEILVLRTELQSLAHSINDTKTEIILLHTNDENDDRLGLVSHELDAVVGATERATEGILDAAEKIDSVAQALRAYKADPAVMAMGASIVDHVMQIFENCNFQDITGQRIGKVVKTLKFVEERVDKMISIWGSEDMNAVTVEHTDPIDEDSRLLNGPQLEGRGVTQDEIDKMFG